MKKKLIFLLILCTTLFINAENNTITSRLIADSVGIDDKSFNGAAWRGILDFYGDTKESQSKRGEYYDVVSIGTQDLFVPNLKQTVDKGYDLIIATGFIFAKGLVEVAKLYPEQNFMMIDADWINEPNIHTYTFAEEQGAFLVGALVALQSIYEGIENPKFGFIGGVPGSVITKFEVGYIQGIKYILPDLPDSSIVDYYTNNFSSSQEAKIQAKFWYDSGVYAIFSAAGRGGSGVISQAKEYREQGKNVWAIGVDSDQYEEGLYTKDKSAVLTSMIKKVENATIDALRNIQNNTFEGGTTKLDLSSGGVGYSTRNNAIPQDILDEVKSIEQKILSGEIQIYDTFKSASATGKVPKHLNAKDD